MRNNIDQFSIAQRGKENLPCPTLILFGTNKLTGRLCWPTSTLSLRPTQKRFLLQDKKGTVILCCCRCFIETRRSCLSCHRCQPSLSSLISSPGARYNNSAGVKNMQSHLKCLLYLGGVTHQIYSFKMVALQKVRVVPSYSNTGHQIKTS